MVENQNSAQKSRRGFAAMSSERQRAIASQGGRAAHLKGVAHEWSKDEARQAGRIGGMASGKKRSGEEEKEERLK